MGARASKVLQDFDLSWDELLKFRLEKVVEIKVWQVGLFQRTCQLMIVLYVVLTLYLGDKWAYSEAPAGSINAWPSAGDWLEHANLPNLETLRYCASPGYTFIYSSTFAYKNPECEIASPWQISRKGTNKVSFTTAFTETQEVGWPCADAAIHAAETAACSARGGTLSGTSGTQCTCSKLRTVYPVGVDLMSMAFEHSATAQTAASSFATLKASSKVPSGQAGGLRSTILSAANGTQVSFESGAAVRMHVRDWLALAGLDSLDATNLDLEPDATDATKYPRFRTSGILVDITIEYSNVDPATRRPSYWNETIHANVRPEAKKSQWAGDGPLVQWNQYPTGPRGARRYDKVEMYRQGIIFQFRTTGKLFRMDWYFFFNTVISGLVLLSTAKSATAMYACYLAPNAPMIKTRTREQFKLEHRLADIGLKAALAISEFRELDSDGDGQLQPEELTRAYARIPGVTFEQAFAITNLVIATGDTFGDRKDQVGMLQGKKNRIADLSEETKGSVASKKGVVDFKEYMVSSEGGHMVTWDAYLQTVMKEATIDPEIDREACESAFNEERSRVCRRSERVRRAQSVL